MRLHKIGDEVEVRIPIDHPQLNDLGAYIKGVVTAVGTSNIDGEIAVIESMLELNKKRTFSVPLHQIKQNYTIDRESAEAKANARENEAMQKALLVPCSEAEWVLYGDDYMEFEDFVQKLAEDAAYDDNGSCTPEFVYVADKAPLQIRTRETVTDFTCDWDEHFSEWTYPPEWEGTAEFQAAIDEFRKAADRFEAANSQWFSLHCNHRKKVSVYELVKNNQCEGVK
jgi:hypothetical protein